MGFYADMMYGFSGLQKNIDIAIHSDGFLVVQDAPVFPPQFTHDEAFNSHPAMLCNPKNIPACLFLLANYSSIANIILNKTFSFLDINWLQPFSNQPRLDICK